MYAMINTLDRVNHKAGNTFLNALENERMIKPTVNYS